MRMNLYMKKELDKFEDLIRNGYKPCSSWFESMVKKLKYDRRKVSQELESAFLGSGDNVIPVETIEQNKRYDRYQRPRRNVCG